MALFDKIKGKAKSAPENASKVTGDSPEQASSKNLAAWAESMPDKLRKMAGSFDADAMWDKLAKTAAKAGQDLIVMVLTIFNAIESKIPGRDHQTVTEKEKSKVNYLDVAVLMGAIVYFVTPIDLIPDFAPLGFIDDTALLTMAFNSAKRLFKNSDIARANETAARLLGDNFDAEKAAKMTQKIIDASRK